MTDDLVKKARNTVFQKIGRNVCNLQGVEQRMKILVILYSGVYGTANELKAFMGKLEESLAKKSMGLVARELFESVFGGQKSIEAPDNPDEPWMSFRHSIDMKKEDVESLEQALANIIEERNNLIHHHASKRDLKTIVGCQNFADELEAQNERIKAMFLTLDRFIESALEARKVMAEFMETDEFWDFIRGKEVPEKEEIPDPGTYIVTVNNIEPISVNANDPRCADKAIKVTRANCKFGKTKSLKARERNYFKVFGERNVTFKPIALTDDFALAEKAVLAKLDRYRIKGKSGRKNEWLEGIEAKDVLAIVLRTLDDLGISYQKFA